jgi:formylglycine-generating enzyme required for sulfatase activity
MTASTWLRRVGLCCSVVLLGALLPGWSQETKGKKYALLVGVKSYDHNKLSDLKYTENDAEEMANVLTEAKYDEVVVLTTSRGQKDEKKKPTKANVERELARLLKRVTKHDVVLIGLSGHGVQYEVKQGNKKRDESFFCPSDAKIIKSDDFEKLEATMISFRKLFEQLDDSGAGSRLLLIDACRNEAGGSRNADTNAMPNPTKGTAALFACKGGERAFESNDLKHGVFFYHVIQALTGKAKDEKKGNVTWDGLTRYVRANVGDYVEENVGGGAKQTPHLMANVEGDPVLIVPSKEKVKSDRDNFTNSIGMKFVRVKAGTFTMGSPKDEKERPDDEQQHEVEITKDYFIGVTEVTQKQYRTVMGYHPSYFSKDGKEADTGKYVDLSKPAGGKYDVARKDTEDFPVENVSWEDAQEFLKKLNALAAEKKFKVKYRLPTEAEWEYACRGGHHVKGLKDKAQLPFHFKSPTASLSSDKANFDGNYPDGDAEKGKNLVRTCKVGSYEANALGLLDMHGNVWEWCSDWYDEKYYATSPRKDPPGADSGSGRVIRGGSWDCGGRGCRAAHRFSDPPSDRLYTLGFRVAAVPQ